MICRKITSPDILLKCTKCGEEKPKHEFGNRNKSKGSLQSACKKCCTKQRYEHYQKNIEHERKTHKTWNENNKDHVKIYARKKSFKKYGLTEVEYNNILNLQNNKCAICGEVFTKTPNIDHNHDTGQVRGLLCGCCNTAFGQLKENVQTMQKMIDYTKRWNNV